MSEHTEYTQSSVDLSPKNGQIAPPSGDSGPSALGLVPSRTSHTALPEPSQFVAFAHDNRVKRMRTGVITAARLIQNQIDQDPRRYWAGMITFTYASDSYWFRKHISRTTTAIREHLRRRGLPFLYVWVLELTQRGVPHYHLIFWLPHGVSLPKPDTQGWWPHGMTRIEKARKAVGYLAKYASKGIFGTDLPKRARLHGMGGLTTGQRQRYAWWRLPTFVRDVWGSEHRSTRATGGGFISRLTGETMESPFEVIDHLPSWEQITFRRKPDAPIPA